MEVRVRIQQRSIGSFGLVLALLWTLPQTGTAQQWTELAAVGSDVAPARSNAAAIYDPVGHRVVLFGGRGDSGFLNDIWALDLNTVEWTELTPSAGTSPPPRHTPGGVYDEIGHRMVIWSGQASGFFNDVWAFDLTTNTWTDLTPASGGPNTRYGVASIYDPSARELVTFAGFTDAGRFDDTWAFDLQNGQWSDLAPAPTPGRRCLHTASYDPVRHRMVSYGGQRSGPLSDLWAFDLEARSWSELTSATEIPAGRYFSPSVVDPRNDRLLVFGGNRGSAGLSNEVLAFEFGEDRWEVLEPSGPNPSARQGAVAVYVEADERMVVIGGRNTGYLSDVWALDLESTPTNLEEGRPGEQPSRSRPLLGQNFPNPMTSTTTVGFELPTATDATLTVHDMLGREVARLASGLQPAGRNTVVWDGRSSYGDRLASGVYLYQLRTEHFIESRMLTLDAPR